MLSRAFRMVSVAAAMLLLSICAFGEDVAELAIKGLRIGDSVSTVQKKASATCKRDAARPKESKTQSDGVRVATKDLAQVESIGYQSCSLTRLTSLGGLEVSRFDLVFYDDSLQQIIVNMHWKPPRGMHTGMELERRYKDDIAAWLQAIRGQYANGSLTERQFRHRASFDVLHWSYPQGTADLTVTTYYRSSDNIVLVLEGTAFRNREKAREAMEAVAQKQLQLQRAVDAKRKQDERAEKIGKDLQ